MERTVQEKPAQPEIILSFDIEEHYRIEAAVGVAVSPQMKGHYAERMESLTHWLLDQLAARGLKATFFFLGQPAQANPALVRAVYRAGHELASHGWDHQRLFRLTPELFRIDVRRSKDVLEQITGAAVRGYRAPTFSLVPRTAWAIDVLAEEGFAYDSSIYPIRHDRYGVPAAPRFPFRVHGPRHSMVELPAATLRLWGTNLPAGGGGYFRLFPLSLMEGAIRQGASQGSPPVVMLYFHPWEFDPDQPRLPLSAFSRWRTYVGMKWTRKRLQTLLQRYTSVRAIDVVNKLSQQACALPSFPLVHAKEAGTKLPGSDCGVDTLRFE